MSTLALTCQGRRVAALREEASCLTGGSRRVDLSWTRRVVQVLPRRISPAWPIALLTLAALVGLAVAVVQLVTTAGPVLLAAGCLAVAGWLVHAGSTAGVLPWLVLLAALVAVSPWLALAVLVWLALRTGGGRDA